MKETIIAKRYSKALFLAVKSDKDNSFEKITEELKSIVNIYNNKDNFLNNIMVNPFFSQDEKLAVIDKLCLIIKSSNITSNFLKILIKKSRMILINLIYSRFCVEVDFNNNITRATIESANKLKENEINSIILGLKNYIDSEIKIKQYVNPDLIGGIKAKIGGFIFDNTIEGQLQNMQLNLML